jgi:hypothetical protein
VKPCLLLQRCPFFGGFWPFLFSFAVGLLGDRSIIVVVSKIDIPRYLECRLFFCPLLKEGSYLPTYLIGESLLLPHPTLISAGDDDDDDDFMHFIFIFVFLFLFFFERCGFFYFQYLN